MGTPEFAVPSLKKIVAAGYEIVLVVTSPDKPRARGNSDPEPTPVKRAAMDLGLRVFEVEDLKSVEFLEAVKAASPDVIAVVAFRILPQEIFTLARTGTFNLHASLLPKYRGAAPINWAVIEGEKETGVTTFFLQEKVDTGNIILQRRMHIGEQETATDLAARLSVLGAEAVLETLQQIESNTFQLTTQNNALATKAPKLSKDNTKIDWTADAVRTHNFVRGLALRPAAWTTFAGKTVKVFQTALAETPFVAVSGGTSPSEVAGTWLVSGEKLFAACGDGYIEILSMQIEGKKRLAAADFLRGYRAGGSEKFE